MGDNITEVINDLSDYLKIEIKTEDIHFFSEGTTSSIVFRIKNKYLVKIVDENTLNTQLEFLEFYSDIKQFQKIIYYNKKLKYICFEYIEGEKLTDNKIINSKEIAQKIYYIVSKYKEYDYNKYGYLWDDHKTWKEFLQDEVNYAKSRLKIDKEISLDKVNEAIENISQKRIKKYLIHGDLGAHNFITSNNEIMVIDPMPVVGDYLYDFYFAMLSDTKLFDKAYIKYILDFFDRDIKYKKALFIVVLYIRMCRSYIYNKKEFEIYLKLYEEI